MSQGGGKSFLWIHFIFIFKVTTMIDVLKYSVGIDISMEKFDAGFGQLPTTFEPMLGKTRKFKNQAHGFKDLERWIEKNRKHPNCPLIIVMEATGVYHERLAYYLHQNGYQVCVLLPSLSSYYLKSQGHRSKNDSIDASGLTLMGLEKKLTCWQPPSAFMRQLRTLVRHRQRVQELITRTNNQMHALQNMAFPSPEVKKSLKKMITSFKKEVNLLELQIHQQVAQDPDLKAKMERIIKSIKGVGWITMVTLIAETNQFEMFTSRQQLIKYAGYDVIEFQSGRLKGKERISKRGNHRIRRIMHMPALNVVTFETGTFPQFYQKIYDRSNVKMKAYVAIQRKLLCLIFALWKKDEVFDDKYIYPLAQKTTNG